MALRWTLRLNGEEKLVNLSKRFSQYTQFLKGHTKTPEALERKSPTANHILHHINQCLIAINEHACNASHTETHNSQQ